MIPGFIDKSQLPRRPGVYIFKDDKSRVLYVGKAIDLYHRVASYFTNRSAHPRGVVASHLRNEIRDVETIIVESELEALILEANLIKKFLPKFNARLTDDKDYLYIGITKEDFPKVITLRKQDLKSVKKFFGPFPSARTVRGTLKLLRRVFPWCANPLRNSNYRIVNIIPIRDRKRCFYYHLNLCPGPCAGLITKEDYRKIIKRLTLLLDGKKEKLLNGLFSEMKKQAHDEKFEEAAKIKKMIDGINYLTQPDRTKFYLENPNFLEDETKKALKVLKEDLSLSKIPGRIEAYDISNIQGKDATGSLVVLINGEIDKSEYRRFKIRASERPNDVGMMREVIGRRLTHTDWPKPDLILVDGGRGQVRAAKFQITNSKLQIPVFGLAKKMEWLYPPEGKVIKLPKKSLSLKLMQKLRDEAHRFAVSYYRKLHRKTTFY